LSLADEPVNVMLEMVDPFNAVNFSAESAKFETGATVVDVVKTGATVVDVEETGATVVDVVKTGAIVVNEVLWRTARVMFPETDAPPGTGSKRTTHVPPGDCGLTQYNPP
jgi:hypothetical protein